jgi:copper chaperone CopZ
MSKALICINTESDKEDVIRNLKKVKGVDEVHSSLGAYDVEALV